MEERIAVIGLGYVGLPVALAFARKYPGTIGFDIHREKVGGIEPEIRLPRLLKAADKEACGG